jgi:hypothetical protein
MIEWFRLSIIFNYNIYNCNLRIIIEREESDKKVNFYPLLGFICTYTALHNT